MRSNHLLFPAVSLLSALLAVAAPALTATAKTCFYDAVCNNSCSKQAKVDQDLTKEKGKPIAYNEDARITGTGQVIPDGQNSAESLIRNMSQRQDCQSIMKLNGYLTRAQFECGFNSYSDTIIQEARDCAQSLTESQTMELLESGRKAFDREEEELGRARICQDVLRYFPGTIRK